MPLYIISAPNEASIGVDEYERIKIIDAEKLDYDSGRNEFSLFVLCKALEPHHILSVKNWINQVKAQGYRKTFNTPEDVQ